MTATHSLTQPRLAYGVAEAARALGVSRDLVHDLIRRGELPSRKLGARTVIPAPGLERLLTTETPISPKPLRTDSFEEQVT